MAINEHELLQRIEALEKRVAALEKSDNPKDEKREYVIQQKDINQSCTSYILTSKNRIFEVSYGFWNMLAQNESTKRQAIQYLENALNSVGDSISNYKIPEEIGKIHAKYAGDLTCPAIIGAYVLKSNGYISGMTPTSKKIKFS